MALEIECNYRAEPHCQGWDNRYSVAEVFSVEVFLFLSKNDMLKKSELEHRPNNRAETNHG